MKLIPLERCTNALEWHGRFYANEIGRILKLLASGKDEFGRDVQISFKGSRVPAPQTDDARVYFSALAAFNDDHDIVVAKVDKLEELIKQVGHCQVPEDAEEFVAKLFDYRHFYKGEHPVLCLPKIPKRPRKNSPKKVLMAKITWETNEISAGGKGPLNVWNTWRFLRELESCPDTNVKVCPYCNADRIYSLMIEKNGELVPSRSALDHYYAKEQYPYLACSLYNLVPSCTRCNSPFKHTYENKPSGDRLSHPYRDDFDSELRFSWGEQLDDAYENKVRPDSIAVKLKPGLKVTDAYDRAVESEKIFHLHEVYNQMFADEACEVAGVFQKIYTSWPDDTLKTLGVDVVGLQVSPNPSTEEISAIRQAVKRLLLRCDFDRSKINSQSLSKFKIDLMEELEKRTGGTV